MILLVDNYDSFTFNLVQELAELGADPTVVRNDEWTLDDVRRYDPDGIVISPGPGTPTNARDVGISNDVIRELGPQVPLLGVCLGHQCIGEAFGGQVVSAGEIMHGKTSMISHDGQGLFEGLPNPFEAIRYHSLAIAPDSVPAVLEVIARSDSGVIMGVRHRHHLVEGVQFHPESIMTKHGHDLLRNFLRTRLPAGVTS